MAQNLLLVEEPTVAAELAEILLDVGYNVAARASSVGEALGCIEHVEVDAAIVDVRVGGEWSFAVADELDERRVPFLFSTSAGVDSIPPRHRGRPFVQLPFQVPGLIVAVTRLTGLDDGGPRRTGALMGQSYTRADLTRVERILAEGKARVARIEQLLGTYRTREGKALLFELHQTLSTMQQHRNQVRRALGLPLSFGDHARR